MLLTYKAFTTLRPAKSLYHCHEVAEKINFSLLYPLFSLIFLSPNLVSSFCCQNTRLYFHNL